MQVSDLKSNPKNPRKISQDEKPKNLGGRPRKYDNPEDLQAAVDAYFQERDELKKPYTITGLALALGFNSRTSLLDYQGDKRFMNIIKTAKTKVESYYEESLHSGQVVAGIIFGLKANFKWEDRSQVDHTTNGKDINNITVVIE